MSLLALMTLLLWQTGLPAIPDVPLEASPPIQGDPTRYHVGKIEITGAAVLTTEQIIQTARLKLSGVVDRLIVEAAAKRIEEAYADRGYLRAMINVEPNYLARAERQRFGTVDISIKLDEGAAFFVRRLEFVGNETTRDRIVRKQMRFDNGSRYRQRLIDESLERLNRLGRFEKLTRKNIELDVNDSEHFVDILVRLKERDRNNS